MTCFDIIQGIFAVQHLRLIIMKFHFFCHFPTNLIRSISPVKKSTMNICHAYNKKTPCCKTPSRLE